MKFLSILDTTAAPLDACDPAADRVVDGAPQARATTLAERGDISAGVWRCTPGRWRVRYDEDEYCCILEGDGTLVGEDRSSVDIRAGDEFMIWRGFVGEWIVRETMVKRYLVVL